MSNIIQKLLGNRVSRSAAQETSINRNIFFALITIGFLGLFAKFAVMIKDLFVAHQYGVTDQLDAFLIAYVIPLFATNVIAGSFNAALIPTYVQVREKEGPESAHHLFSGVMVWSTLLLVGVCVLLALIGPYILPLLSSGFHPEKIAFTQRLYLALLPLLITTGLTTIWAATLNAGERFALAAIVPIVTPLVMVLSILVMNRYWGMYALVYGALGGSALELGFLAFGLRAQKIPVIPRTWKPHPAVKLVFKQYSPMVVGAFLMSGTTLIDQGFASRAGSGGVSTLNYANKIVGLLTGLGTIALGTAVLPYFSRMVAEEDWHGIRHTLRTYSFLILGVTLPVTLFFFWQSELFVRLLFQRGAFTPQNTEIVAAVQRLYVLQVPFYLLGILYVRLISALKANHILLWGAVISLIINVVFDYILLKLIGIRGIALSTSIVYLTSAVYVIVQCYRLINRQGNTLSVTETGGIREAEPAKAVEMRGMDAVNQSDDTQPLDTSFQHRAPSSHTTSSSTVEVIPKDIYEDLMRRYEELAARLDIAERLLEIHTAGKQSLEESIPSFKEEDKEPSGLVSDLTEVIVQQKLHPSINHDQTIPQSESEAGRNAEEEITRLKAQLNSAESVIGEMKRLMRSIEIFK